MRHFVIITAQTQTRKYYVCWFKASTWLLRNKHTDGHSWRLCNPLHYTLVQYHFTFLHLDAQTTSIFYCYQHPAFIFSDPFINKRTLLFSQKKVLNDYLILWNRVTLPCNLGNLCLMSVRFIFNLPTFTWLNQIEKKSTVLNPVFDRTRVKGIYHALSALSALN